MAFRFIEKKQELSSIFIETPLYAGDYIRIEDEKADMAP